MLSVFCKPKKSYQVGEKFASIHEATAPTVAHAIGGVCTTIQAIGRYDE